MSLFQHSGSLFHSDRIRSIRQSHMFCLTDPGKCRFLNPIIRKIRHGKYLLRRIKRDLLATMQKKNAVAVSRQFLDLLLDH